MTTRADIVLEARSWVGFPWRHQGRSRLGIDCGGLVVMVGRAKAGWGPKDDLFGYPTLPEPDTLADVCRKYLDVKVGPLEDGDVVLLRPVMAQSWPSHLGIITTLSTGEPGMVHSYGTPMSGGQVVETRYRPWVVRTVAKFCYRGLEE